MPCIDQQAAESLARIAANRKSHAAHAWRWNGRLTNFAKASEQILLARRCAGRCQPWVPCTDQRIAEFMARIATNNRRTHGALLAQARRVNFFSMAIIAHAFATCGRRPLKNVDPKAGGARTVDPKTGARHLDFPYWI